MNKFILLSAVLFITSCTGGCNNGGEVSSDPATVIVKGNAEHENFQPSSTTGSIGQGLDVDALLAKRRSMLGNACSIVPQKVVADALGLTPQDLILRNSTPRDDNPTHTSCFFKWEDYDLPNAGILLQLMRNPTPEDFEEYVPVFIESFRLRGEQGVGEEPIVYRKFEGFGDDGSYSTEGGKYFWRLGDKIIFGIAFNTTHAPEEQYQIATTLAKVMTENYIKGR